VYENRSREGESALCIDEKPKQRVPRGQKHPTHASGEPRGEESLLHTPLTQAASAQPRTR
jgi:hypothetical protein